VALGPAEVHPEEHLGPVRGLRAAGAGADRQDGGPLVVLAVEEQLGPLAAEVALERGALAIKLGAQIRVVRLLEELGGRFEIPGAGQETVPQLDLGSEAIGLAKDFLGSTLIVPEPGFAGQRLQLGEASFSCRKVKDAPRSTGSAPPGRGRLRRPSVSGLEILEQDRTELDESEGRLAPGDDGVHAGTVAVVGTDAAIAIAVEGGGVAAGAAISLTGDEIDEGRFLSLLHESLTSRLIGFLGGGTIVWRGNALETIGSIRGRARNAKGETRRKRNFDRECCGIRGQGVWLTVDSSMNPSTPK